MPDFDSVKDSGQRQEWETGSRRDTRDGKGRYDLIPPYFIKRLARHLENGAAKYGDRNWELGQPLSRYLDSGLRHTFCLLDGETDEDHAAAAVWNLMAYICTAEWVAQGRLPGELDDLGHVEVVDDDSNALASDEAGRVALFGISEQVADLILGAGTPGVRDVTTEDMAEYAAAAQRNIDRDSR